MIDETTQQEDDRLMEIDIINTSFALTPEARRELGFIIPTRHEQVFALLYDLTLEGSGSLCTISAVHRVTNKSTVTRKFVVTNRQMCLVKREHGVDSFIIAHTHNSGKPQPSKADYDGLPSHPVSAGCVVYLPKKLLIFYNGNRVYTTMHY